MQIHHKPVFLDTLLSLLEEMPKALFIDCTLGEGGHTEAFLQRGLSGVAIERDPAILKKAQTRLAEYGENIQYWQGSFDQALEPVFEKNKNKYNFVLFDLGISMFHYKESGRGFSFQSDEALDMRLSPDLPLSAADIIADWREEQLADCFYELGGEKKSRQIARNIVRNREKTPVRTARDLSRLIAPFYPPSSPIHPATRVFQALRIEVNQELEKIEAAVKSACENIMIGGMVCVIAYHSLEDIRVKKVFQELVPKRSNVNKYRQELEQEIKKNDFKLYSKKPLIPDENEIRQNRAARSAKMRILIRTH